MTTDHDELAWIRDRRPEPSGPDAEGTVRARTALLEHITTTEARPARAARVAEVAIPISRAHVRRRPALHRLAKATALAAVAAAAVIVTVGSLPAGEDSSGGVLVAPSAEAATFATLAARFGDQPAPTGDATLVLRAQRTSDRSFTGVDLYTDDGRYVYAPTLEALRSGGADRTEGGARTRSLAAAAAAATSLPPRTARERLLRAANISLERDPAQIDTLVWAETMNALTAGAGRADVRAGAMRLLSTLPAIELRRTTVNARPVIEVSNADFPDNYRETLLVDAQTGVPVGFKGGQAGQTPDVVVDYDVRRIEAASVLPD